MLWLTDFQESVVRVDTLGLTFLAQIVVVALGALVADAHDVLRLAVVADDVLVFSECLVVIALLGGIESILKTAANQLLDLIASSGHLAVQVIHAEVTSTVALLAWLSSLLALAPGALHVVISVAGWLLGLFG